MVGHPPNAHSRLYYSQSKEVIEQEQTKLTLRAPVWEIVGAEFSDSNHHTANKLSIRFPRVVRIRDDKDWEGHTNLEEFVKIKEASKTIG